MGNFRLDSSAQRAISTPVLAQLRRLSSASSLSDRAADRANPGTDARANLEHGFSAVRTNSSVASTSLGRLQKSLSRINPLWFSRGAISV
jgi:hypothetical protein